jgi:hypothetical protein
MAKTNTDGGLTFTAEREDDFYLAIGLVSMIILLLRCLPIENRREQGEE